MSPVGAPVVGALFVVAHQGSHKGCPYTTGCWSVGAPLVGALLMGNHKGCPYVSLAVDGLHL